MDKPIRILQIMGILDRGGAETMIMNLFRNIDRTKIQFDFIVHTNQKGLYDDEALDLGASIYHCPSYRGYNHLTYVMWWEHFFSAHPEYSILHTHIRSCASVFLPIAHKHHLITISHSHSISNGNGIYSLAKHFFQHSLESKADYCMACSQAAGEWLFPHRDFTILNNAIDSKKFRFNAFTREQLRKEFGIESCFVVGTVGRLETPKNPDGIITIIKALRNITPNIKFLWVGDGTLKTHVEKALAAEELQDNVIMTGVRTDVERLMQAMDVFVMPSLWEGLPLVGIEAQASGLPCIFSEKVPRELMICDNCEFIALDNTSEWVSHIMAMAKDTRIDTYQRIVDSGYDINTTVRWLENYYLEMAAKQ